MTEKTTTRIKSSRNSTISFLRLFLKVGLAFALVGTMSACDRKREPSILIVAIDSLAFNLSLCTRDTPAESSGFRRLCDESIRFTHAATPSVLAVPSLASLLTGLNPVDHGVRHNGNPGLRADASTFGEIALKRHRRTSFYSGGAPIWRRTGLHQGFEVFDDFINLTSGKLFRPFRESSSAFQQWLNEIGSEPFVSIIYASDLNFTDTVTETSSGEMRPLNDESQLEELDEALAELFDHLKKRNRWNDTVIVVTGLNGRELSPRIGEIEPLLLNSENTQISLFIKPTSKQRDEAIHWKVDRNVNLSDVGRTIFDLLGETPAPSHSGMQSVSLRAALTSAQPDWLEDRILPIESGWASWQGWGPVRMGALIGYDLVLDDEKKPVVFNTLVDRLETSPQNLGDNDRRALDRLQIAGSVPWPGLPASQLALFRLQRLDWMVPTRAASLHTRLQKLAETKNADTRVLRWAAQLSLEQKDWSQLAALGKKAKVPLWTAVAERNLGKRTKIEDPCIRLFEQKGDEPHETRACPDETMLLLYQAVRADLVGENRENARRRFARAWDNHQMDLRILKANAGMGLLWLPASAEEGLPSLASLALALPELKRFNP